MLQRQFLLCFVFSVLFILFSFDISFARKPSPPLNIVGQLLNKPLIDGIVKIKVIVNALRDLDKVVVTCEIDNSDSSENDEKVISIEKGEEKSLFFEISNSLIKDSVTCFAKVSSGGMRISVRSLVEVFESNVKKKPAPPAGVLRRSSRGMVLEFPGEME